MNKLTLIVPEKTDSERDQVAQIWQADGGEVLRLGRFWEPPILNSATARVYGNDTFCLVLAQKLNLNLVTPADDLIFSVPPKYLHRKIEHISLAEAGALSYPIFLKSLIPKQFTSKVYPSFDALQAETRGLEPDTRIIASETVTFVAEARCFILQGKLLTISIYEGTGTLEDATLFINQVLAEPTLVLPQTLVIDIGLLKDNTWCFLEANATWGAGLNGCEPQAVAECLRASVV